MIGDHLRQRGYEVDRSPLSHQPKIIPL